MNPKEEIEKYLVKQKERRYCFLKSIMIEY